MLPIRPKPTVRYNYTDFITVIPNVLGHAQIKRLRDYMHSDISGIHRRGSKDKNTNASFNTCQVHPLNDELYGILDHLWTPYTEINFIEPYELKEYIEGDEFDYHVDTYINLYEKIERKMNLIIQLSDSNEYEGGDLVVGDYTCSRQLGDCIIFPACLHHAVKNIVSGTRYSLIGHGWGPYI